MSDTDRPEARCEGTQFGDRCVPLVCGCGHPYETHTSAVCGGCNGRNDLGFPCRCKGTSEPPTTRKVA